MLVHIYRRSQYERYSLAVTSDGKVGPSGVVLRPPHGSKSDNVDSGLWGVLCKRVANIDP